MPEADKNAFSGLAEARRRFAEGIESEKSPRIQLTLPQTAAFLGLNIKVLGSLRDRGVAVQITPVGRVEWVISVAQIGKKYTGTLVDNYRVLVNQVADMSRMGEDIGTVSHKLWHSWDKLPKGTREALSKKGLNPHEIITSIQW